MELKKILNIVWVLLLALFLCQLVNYCSNEQMIEQYEDGEYEISQYAQLGFFEPYISHYNAGNIYYQKQEYEMAEDQYEKALKTYSPSGRNVKIRINLALSIATPVNPDYISASEIDETVEHLREAQGYLLYNNYANEDGTSGEHGKAQILYNDIEDLIQQLLEKQEEQNEEEDQKDQQDQSGQNDQDSQDGQDNQDGQNNQDNQDEQDGQDGQDDQDAQDDQNQDDQNNQNDQSNQNEQDDQDNQNGQDDQDDQEGQEEQDNQDSQQQEQDDPIRDEISDLMDQGAQQRNDDLNYDQYMFEYNDNNGKNW